jgi:hypothetical protein
MLQVTLVFVPVAVTSTPVCCRFTWNQGFQGLLREVHDMASQHETVSEELSQQVQTALVNLAKECKENRRKVLLLSLSSLVLCRLSVVVRCSVAQERDDDSLICVDHAGAGQAGGVTCSTVAGS